GLGCRPGRGRRQDRMGRGRDREAGRRGPGDGRVTVTELSNDREQLRRLEALTDQALAHLDLERMLDELLDRIIDLLGVDTAEVLLIDESTNELVATAAKHLEEEVRHGFRLPVGQGFAGTIVATGSPRTIEHVDESNVVSPIIRRLGIR